MRPYMAPHDLLRRDIDELLDELLYGIVPEWPVVGGYCEEE